MKIIEVATSFVVADFCLSIFTDKLAVIYKLADQILSINIRATIHRLSCSISLIVVDTKFNETVAWNCVLFTLYLGDKSKLWKNLQ